LGTVLSLGLVVVAVYFLRAYRKRLLPGSGRRDRGEALTQLHLLQAEMRGKLEEGQGLEELAGSEDRMGQTEDRATAPPPEPPDEESRKEALAELQALQSKMRKKLEEDQAREARSELDLRSPDLGAEDDDSGPEHP